MSFQIGIIDAWGNQSYVNFPSTETTYGLVRNGDWGHASFPVEDGLLEAARQPGRLFQADGVVAARADVHVGVTCTLPARSH